VILCTRNVCKESLLGKKLPHFAACIGLVILSEVWPAYGHSQWKDLQFGTMDSENELQSTPY
jgi:hypothetical protein